jgi:hypothetical protein
MEQKKATRRRKWKRFKTKGGALVLIKKMRIIEVGKPALVELGPVVDISMGGLSAQYVENKQRIAESEALAISVPPESVQVEPIPYKIIKDIEVTKMPDGKPIRTRCVQFGKLSDYQSFQLKSFIKEHTTEIIEDRRKGGERRQFDDPSFDEEEYRKMYDRRILRERRGS